MKMYTANLIIMPPLLVISLIVFNVLSQNEYAVVYEKQKIIFAFFLLLCNFGVLTHHWIAPPPPKFSMNVTRKKVLFGHLLGGTIELFACFFAYIFHSPELAIIAALAALLVHLPAALYMLPDVYGAKGVMIPTYTVLILLNSFFAVKVLMNPTNLRMILDLFITLNTYVLVRVFYFLFEKTGLFASCRYTASIIIGGFMIGPAVLGPIWSVFFLIYILIDLTLFQKLMKFEGKQITDLYIEHDLTHIKNDIITPILDKNFVYRMINHHPQYSIEKKFSDKELASMYFETMDLDKDGVLNFKEWGNVTDRWKIRSDLERDFYNRITTDGKMDFSAFYKHVWLMGSNLTLPLPGNNYKKLSDKEYAWVVFKKLDLNNTGNIGGIELELLLAQWGLRPPEINTIINKYVNGLNFEEFYGSFPHIWKYYQRLK